MTETQIPEIRIEDIPAMPAVATQVLGITNQEDVKVTEISKLLESDSGLTSKVLQVANSPFYGFSRQIDSVKDGVVLLGLSAIKSLVITVAARNIYKNPGLLENMLWDHSVCTAIGAHHLAKKLGCCDPDAAFTCGMMHDAGKSVINNFDHLRYLKFYQKTYNENIHGKEFAEAEMDAFGYNHHTIGAMVAEKWNLSDEMTDCMTLHHLPEDDTLANAKIPGLLAVVAQANAFSYYLGVGTREPVEDIFNIDHRAAENLRLDQENLERLAENIFDSYEEKKSSFDFE